MFTNNINPTLLDLSIIGLPLEIRWYGLMYALGFLFSWWILKKFKHRIEFTDEEVSDFIFYMALALVIGARFFEVVFWEPSYYLTNPLKILYVWQGGLSFHGGLAGMAIAGWWFCKKKNKNLAKVADLFSIPAYFCAGFGRLGNFMNSEICGPITNIPWCVEFKMGICGEGCRHPYQLYAMVKRWAIAGVLFFLYKKPHKDGFIFWMGFLLTSVGRFVLDFYRDDSIYFVGLTIGQFLSFAFALVSIYFLRFYKDDLKSMFSKH